MRRSQMRASTYEQGDFAEQDIWFKTSKLCWVPISSFFPRIDVYRCFLGRPTSVTAWVRTVKLLRLCTDVWSTALDRVNAWYAAEGRKSQVEGFNWRTKKGFRCFYCLLTNFHLLFCASDAFNWIICVCKCVRNAHDLAIAFFPRAFKCEL